MADLQKNILSIIQTKKQIFCTDLNLQSEKSLTSYTATSSDNNIEGKYAKLYLPSIGAEIISANEQEIEVNYSMTFSIPGEPIIGSPEIEPELIYVTCNENLKFFLNFSEIGLQPESVIGRKIIITSSDSVLVESFNLNIITFNTNISFNYTLIKDVELETIFNNFINSLNSENPKILTRFDFPTNNDFFNKYDDFTDVMIGYKNCYKNEEYINDVVGELNIFLRINTDNLINKNNFSDYFNDYNTKISLIYSETDKWIEYFKRLKKLMSKIKISDALVNDEECQNLYDSKSEDSQNDIDVIYDVFLNNNLEVYSMYKQERLYEIKI